MGLIASAISRIDCLYGHALPLDGRIPREQGQVVELGGKKGVFYSESEGEQALQR